MDIVGFIVFVELWKVILLKVKRWSVRKFFGFYFVDFFVIRFLNYVLFWFFLKKDWKLVGSRELVN